MKRPICIVLPVFPSNSYNVQYTKERSCVYYELRDYEYDNTRSLFVRSSESSYMLHVCYMHATQTSLHGLVRLDLFVQLALGPQGSRCQGQYSCVPVIAVGRELAESMNNE